MKKTKEEHNAYMLDWYYRHRDKVSEKLRNKPKSEEQRERHKDSSKKYYETHKEICGERNRRCKEKKKGSPIIRRVRVVKCQKPKRVKLTDQERREKERLRYLKRKPRMQQYNQVNKELINKKYLVRTKNRMQKDPLFKLSRNIPKLIRLSIKREGYSKKTKTYQILGCTFNQFKSYIESKFEHWMTWDNYGKYDGSIGYGWEFDHIIPVSSAKTEEELLKLNHYSNLQPLDGYVNRYIKRNKVA